MAQRKESFFWTSYSDLMTSLFFVMLVLFVLVIVLLHKRMEATEAQLEEIKKIENSTMELGRSEYFKYNKDYRKYVLNINVKYPIGESDIKEINDSTQLPKLREAGIVIRDFLNKHSDNNYALIIEGQASADDYAYNYNLSYERALGLMQYWNSENIRFGNNCEILVSGSGDGKLDTHSMRDTSNEENNQRFLIHILPKNIIDDSKNKKPNK